MAGIAFCALFFSAKHFRFLSAVSPFVEDPYDAVGSFSIQIALAAAIISVLRVTIGGRSGSLKVQRLLVARSEAIVILAILVTALADFIAMLKHVYVWLGAVVGKDIFAALAVLIAFSAASLVFLVRNNQLAELGSQRRASAYAVLLSLVALLAIYPDAWRGTLLASLSNAGSGMLMAFLTIWALIHILLPGECKECELLFYGASRLSLGRAEPGRRAWRYAFLAAIAAGVALCVIEAVGEGRPPTAARAAILFSVILMLEGGGVLVGFLLFRRLLALG